jgi:hypothetical protein
MTEQSFLQDPKVLAALMAALSALVSGGVSYFMARKAEQRKNVLEFLNRKIALLENKKARLIVLGNEKSVGINKETFAESVAEALMKTYDESVSIFREIDHYVPCKLRLDVWKRIENIDQSIAYARAKHHLGSEMTVEHSKQLLDGQEAVKEMKSISRDIRNLINEELLSCVSNVEQIIEAKR